METTASTMNLLANIIKKTLQCFEEWNLKSSLRKKRYSHIDITLSKRNTKHYTIQVTNYGQSTNDVLSFSNKILLDFATTNVIFENSTIATVYNQRADNDCPEILNVHFQQNRLSLVRIANDDNNNVNLIHQKEYLSFVLKNKLDISELETFTSIILEEIVLLQQLNLNVKFTVQIDKKMIYNNYITLDNDYKMCQVLATDLTDIIKRSLDIKFREKCFSMLNVENSHEVEAALMTKLLPLIHTNYIFPSGS
ncbi:uncharacterized protein LOC143425694 [Xylocopa sonorina]|uniref:uncharacterized protein LOC143425694 n=1 Tax=Xylocopa sonorina TaxID=1818115 RepID=UPI00403ACED2